MRSVCASDRERGSAAAEFALVAALLTVLFLAMVQLGFALHVRNTATAQVVEGARYGARADLSPADGAQRARELLSDSLSSSYADQVSAELIQVAGVWVVEVTAVVPLPVFGPLGPSGVMTVTGQAFAEVQP